MLVTFRYSEDKFRIYAGRAVLRDQDILVSDDLTLRQRKQLKTLKDQGKVGYFHKGELKIRPERLSFTNSKRQQGEPNSKRMRFEYSNGPPELMAFDNRDVHPTYISSINSTLAMLAEDLNSSRVRSNANSAL